MSNEIYIDQKYSTTKQLIKNKPIINKNSEDKFESVLFLSNNNNRKHEGGLRLKGYFKKSNHDKPLISIITVVYNGENHIEKTINSVLQQTYSNVEYIIIDGGSSDNTVNIIKKYENQIDYWISEKDSGIADAWNKGIILSSGEIIGILNADDIYSIDTLSIIQKNLPNSEYWVSYGICKLIENNQIIGINDNIFNENNLITGFGFVHTTCFVPLINYKKIGLFDINYKIALDTDFLIRCYSNNIPFIKMSNTTYMSVGGISDIKSKEAFFEYISILRKFNLFTINKLNLMKFIYSIYYPFRFILKSKLLKWFLRANKHILVKIMNSIYNLIPSVSLRNLFLKILKIKIGKDSYINGNLTIYRIGNLIIDKNSVINHSAILDNRCLIQIGKNVSIAHGVKIYTCGHDINFPYFDMKCKNVVIEDYVCIFAFAMIMPGVKVSKGTIILPGSIVTKDTEEYGIYGGNPAKLIKYRKKDLYYKIDYGFLYAL